MVGRIHKTTKRLLSKVVKEKNAKIVFIRQTYGSTVAGMKAVSEDICITVGCVRNFCSRFLILVDMV